MAEITKITLVVVLLAAVFTSFHRNLRFFNTAQNARVDFSCTVYSDYYSVIFSPPHIWLPLEHPLLR